MTIEVFKIRCDEFEKLLDGYGYAMGERDSKRSRERWLELRERYTTTLYDLMNLVNKVEGGDLLSTEESMKGGTENGSD